MIPEQGYQLLRGVFSKEEVIRLQKEADQISSLANTTCVRNITSRSELIRDFPRSIISRNLIPNGCRLVRSILFNKTPDQNWPVPWHQDLTIIVQEKVDLDDYGPWSEKDGQIHVQPPTELLNQMITVRIHLDDTPASNGALRVIPESHLLGKIPSGQVAEHTLAPAVTCASAPGDVLLMSPLILHASSRSSSPQNRRVLHFEFAPENALHPSLTWANSTSA